MALNSNNNVASPVSRWLRIGLPLLLLLAAIIYFSSRKNELLIRTATVERGTLRSQISTNGKVEPTVNFEAHAPAPTTVARVYVHEGQAVKKGQLLMTLDDSDARSQAARAQSQLRAAEADLNNARNGGAREDVLATDAELAKAATERDAAQRNLEAMQRLHEKGAASGGELRDAQNQLQRALAQYTYLFQKRKSRYAPVDMARVEAQLREARAAVAAANDLLSKFNIRAPQAGTVYAIAARQGSFVSNGDLLLQEADLARVLVRSFVDEPDIGRLAPGQPIEITWDALPGRAWKGSVNTIPASVRLLGSRNVGELTCIVDNKDMKLLPNINVGVAIVTAEHANTLLVPREAIRQDDGKSFVYEVQNNVVKRHAVETSISSLTRMEVRGVPEKTVVALGSISGRPLTDGMPVKVATE